MFLRNISVVKRHIYFTYTVWPQNAFAWNVVFFFKVICFNSRRALEHYASRSPLLNLLKFIPTVYTASLFQDGYV
jgi:hypothetical protein